MSRLSFPYGPTHHDIVSLHGCSDHLTLSLLGCYPYLVVTRTLVADPEPVPKCTDAACLPDDDVVEQEEEQEQHTETTTTTTTTTDPSSSFHMDRKERVKKIQYYVWNGPNVDIS